MRLQHQKFALEYIKNGGNGVQAVFAAGYKLGYDSACVRASLLLRSVKVKSMIEDTLIDEKLTAERVSKEIGKIAFTQVKKIDSTAKMKALDLATKVLGMQSSKLETVDLTQHSALESSLLKSINQAAKSENIEQNQAAVALFNALKDDPQFAQVESWPAEFRGIIQQSQQNEQVMDGGDQ